MLSVCTDGAGVGGGAWDDAPPMPDQTDAPAADTQPTLVKQKKSVRRAVAASDPWALLDPHDADTKVPLRPYRKGTHRHTYTQ